ncbi:MAG: hypothetical protein RIA63_01430 [Cyclobacteriaceae bacterium]
MAKLQEKMEFIDDAQMAMHFIKNKLNPIANYVAMSDEFDSGPPSKEIWLDHFIKEKNKSKTNIPLIIQKSEQFHKDVENLFSLSAYEQARVEKVIEILRRNWTADFLEEDIQVSIETGDTNNYTVVINEDLLEVLLTNWISNMRKYGSGLHTVVVSETDESIYIEFANNVENNCWGSAEKFVNDFNSDGKSEIIGLGVSQGLRELRYLVKEMDINNDLFLADDLIIFKLIFPKQYEDSNN